MQQIAERDAFHISHCLCLQTQHHRIVMLQAQHDTDRSCEVAVSICRAIRWNGAQMFPEQFIFKQRGVKLPEFLVADFFNC